MEMQIVYTQVFTHIQICACRLLAIYAVYIFKYIQIFELLRFCI